MIRPVQTAPAASLRAPMREMTCLGPRHPGPGHPSHPHPIHPGPLRLHPIPSHPLPHLFS